MLGGAPTVLFLHPSDELYGADRQLLALLAASGDTIRPVVVLPDDLPYGGALSATLAQDGICVLKGRMPVLRRRYASFRALPGWLASAARGTVWLSRVARRERARVIVSNSTAIPVGPLVARLAGARHIWLGREIIESPSAFRGVVRTVARLAPGRVLVVSGAVAAWLGPIAGRGPDVLHDGTDVATHPQPLRGGPSAVYVGRLSDWKGWDVFVAAARRVRERCPEATFTLVGGVVPGASPSEDEVRSVIHAADPTATWMTWAGELPNARPAITRAWVVAVPSRRPDPFPNVVLEAMSAGRAVVGTNAGGIPEMVRDGETGLLVSPDDELALADALARLLMDRAASERMGQAGAERVRTEFSRAAFTARWSAILHEQLQAAGT